MLKKVVVMLAKRVEQYKKVLRVNPTHVHTMYVEGRRKRREVEESERWRNYFPGFISMIHRRLIHTYARARARLKSPPTPI